MTLQEQLIRDEGLRRMPYKDTQGKLTIGVGRNLDDVGISESEALYLLDNDMARVEREVQLSLPWTVSLSPARWSVVINMAFNMGIQRLLGFEKMLAALREHQWSVAAREMLDSLWAHQVGDRAQRLSLQMETDQWQ